uniref:Uncharacterized protein n=1 Tax=Anguilla anguilla TaxID=7936 RepID=A0A0E9PCJ8_ANGAN
MSAITGCVYTFLR